MSVRCDRCGTPVESEAALILHLIRVAHAPKVYVQPPVGTLVTVPDGGAAPVTGRVVRYDEDMCVVAKQDDPTYEVWAFIEEEDIVREH